MSDDFRLIVWGARGSRQVSDMDKQRYGGDTSCFEVRAGDRSIMIDCGSGALTLEDDLIARGVCDLDLLLTHSHLDHVMGLPFFRLCYMNERQVRVHIGHLEKGVRGDRPFQALFDPLLFPVPVKTLKAMRVNRFYPPEKLALGPFDVETIALNHPGGAVGYRIHFADKSIALITDHEHGDAAIDGAVIGFCRDVDILLIDAMYTDEEYVSKAGWGHATPQAAIEIARAAGAKKVVLSHHAPWRTDADLDALITRLRPSFSDLHAAAAGQSYAVN